MSLSMDPAARAGLPSIESILNATPPSIIVDLSFIILSYIFFVFGTIPKNVESSLLIPFVISSYLGTI